MQNVELIDKLVQIHDLNKEEIEGLFTHLENVIVSVMLSSLQDGEKEVIIDLVLGQLVIRRYEKEITYQFIPSKSMREKMLGADPLRKEIENKIQFELKKLYKEFLL